ncbi:MAG: prepilin-type N-terminal cleavage/methylation domain-containing protein [Pseudomonadaceae bacterium]|nr:prepilin-type N-terminal cleavage/methylation domain-containing protein [Pseudomonadaceae bacterium]
MKSSREQGFTLLELVGVMAVIATIGALAAPRIIDAIEDARVTALVMQVSDLKANVAGFYADTGRWPRHIPTHPDTRYRQLLHNDAGANVQISGWQGPYLESELNNPIVDGGYVDLMATSSTQYACDLDADGAMDGAFYIYRIDGVDMEIGRKVSNLMDKDGHLLTGNNAWNKAGRVKTYSGGNNTILIVCLAKI